MPSCTTGANGRSSGAAWRSDVQQPDGAVGRSSEREYEETSLGPVIHRTADRLFVVRSINVEWSRQYEGFFELHAGAVAATSSGASSAAA